MAIDGGGVGSGDNEDNIPADVGDFDMNSDVRRIGITGERCVVMRLRGPVVNPL